MDRDTANRAPNFTLSEKSRLFTIAMKYKHIIEDKKTDRTSINDKQKAWTKIASEFNASSPNSVYRTAESLRKAYDNKKKVVRKQVAEERRQIMLTGGGPPPKIKKDECFDLILSIVNEKTINGLKNNYDSDNSAIEKPILSTEDKEQVFELTEIDDRIEMVMEEEIEENQLNNNEIIDNTYWNGHNPSHLEKPSVLGVFSGKEPQLNPDKSEDNNWKKYTPSQLNKPISAALKTPSTNKSEPTRRVQRARTAGVQNVPTRRSTTTIRALSSSIIAEKYDSLMDKRLQLADLQLAELRKNSERAEEEHELKINHLKLQVDKLKQEIEINKTRNKLMFT